MKNYLVILALALPFVFSCVDDKKQQSQKEGGDKEELLIGTWIKSVDAGNKMIDIGFEFREDHIVNYINQPRTLGRDWKIKDGDSLVIFYENRIYGDSIESAVYYIESVNETELRLKPRHASKNYMDIYTRK